MTTEQSLAKQSTKKELKDWLQGENFKRQVAAALPRTMSPERFVRVALQATYRNPDLLKCSQESFFNCLFQLAALGLEPDGRRAHLVPFGNDCSLIVDYKGIKELLRRNKDVAAMHCDVVGENDHFEIRFGTRGILDHIPNLKDRGEIYCAYSWVRLPDGNEEFDVMGIDEIDSIRKRSRTPNKGPWVSDYNEMAKKTVFRRHSKSLPLSPETREALEREDDGDALTENERFANARTLEPVEASVASERHNIAKRQRKALSEDPRAIGGHSDAVSVAQNHLPPSEPSAESTTKESEGQMPAVPEATLAELVFANLRNAGFEEAELLTVLRQIKMVDANITSLKDVRERVLNACLEDWDNALRRMRDIRRAKSQTTQGNLSV